MTRKEFLEKRKARLEKRRDDLIARGQASTDVNEVRSINDQVSELNVDLDEIREEISMIEDEQRANPPATAALVNGSIVAGFTQKPAGQQRSGESKYGSMEYRMAFKAHVQTGAPIPAEFRSDDAANTNSLGATIPETVLNEFINEIRKRYGNLYAKVRKLNIKGGVKVPIAELQATFKWVTEATVSPRQDGGKIDQFVQFSYNTAEVRVAQTLLSSIVSLDLFEREIVRIMMIAYLQAMDIGIVKGTGVGQMLGILNDPRVLERNQVVTFTAAELSDWTKWRKKLFAKMPLGYRAGEFIFPVGTVDAYLETMADSNNNPIFRQATGLEVNDGDAVNPNGRFFGRDISLVEPDIIQNFDDAESGDVIGIYWQPEEYAINTNMAFGLRRWFDEDRNEWVNKMLTIVDGRVLNPCGIWILKKA